MIWEIRLNMARRKSVSTTHKCIRSTVYLSQLFCMDKYQLRYKQLTRTYGKFYNDYLKVVFWSFIKFIGRAIYTNKLRLHKFSPYINGTSEEIGHTLWNFIKLDGLPCYEHSHNRSNFKKGLFKKILRKSDILPNYRVVPDPDENLISVLRAKDLRTSLLKMRTCNFFTLLYVGGTYARLSYTWC